VKRKDEYVIRFSELKEEKETFDFELGDSFFTVFENAEWEGGRIKATIEIQKRPDGLTLDFFMKGNLMVACDRCLETFPLKVKTRERLFVKYGEAEEELDANIVTVDRDENRIDLGPFFYEYLVLSIPVKKVHPEDESGEPGCDSSMIEKLNQHIIRENTETIDPRWEELKKLLDKN